MNGKPASGAFTFSLLLGALVLAAIAYAALGARPASRDDATLGASRGSIEELVRNYILENPEIIPEAINRLQQREVAKLLDSNRAEIETPFAGAWAGDEDGDIVLVEFFDYNCPYCKVMHDEVQRLLADDDDLKVVYRDFPVLGAVSDEAALASLSAAKQGRYAAFQKRLLTARDRLSHEAVVAAVRAAGLDEMKTAADMRAPALKAEIQKNLELGRALGLTGTPTYIVGNRILSGAVGHDELKKAIAEARALRD